MRLKKLSQFRIENIEPDEKGRRPDMRTLTKWPGVMKIGGTWYIDIDFSIYIKNRQQAIDDEINTLAGDDEDLLNLSINA